MKKIILPIVLMSSLIVLASCEEKPNQERVGSSRVNRYVTGSVVTTPPVVATGATEILTATASTTPPVPSQVESQSGVSVVTPPVIINRKETISYSTPKRDVEIDFDVTLTDGIITAVTAISKTEQEYSKDLQAAFVENISASAVGKKAKDLNLDVVGGASLTTAAFEKFVQTI